MQPGEIIEAPARVSRRIVLVVAALTILAALLRFAWLAHKGFWFDEIYTLEIVRRPFGDAMHGVWTTEASPPLYFVLVWGWTRLFGMGEAGLRSLSAVVGTATVPFMYLAGRDLASRSVGVAAAALIAVNPFVVSYGQEARAYALLVLLISIGLWCFARALRDPTPRRLMAWAAVSSAALITHYFAALIIAGEAAWLFHRRSSIRQARMAGAALLVTGAALAPLLIHQARAHDSSFVAELPLRPRITGIPGGLLLGDNRPGGPALTALGIALAVGGLLLVRRGTPVVKRGVLVAASLAAFGVLVPVIAAVMGVDYLLETYLIGTEAAIAVVLGAGFATTRIGWALGIALGALSIVAIAVAIDRTKYGWIDFRDAAAAIAPARPPTAIVVTPADRAKPLELYAGARKLDDDTSVLRVREVDVLGEGEQRGRAIAPAPGFRLVSRRTSSNFTLLRWQADSPTSIPADQLSRSALGSGGVDLWVIRDAQARRR